jgi:hypothetical protein
VSADEYNPRDIRLSIGGARSAGAADSVTVESVRCAYATAGIRAMAKEAGCTQADATAMILAIEAADWRGWLARNGYVDPGVSMSDDASRFFANGVFAERARREGLS